MLSTIVFTDQETADCIELRQQLQMRGFTVGVKKPCDLQVPLDHTPSEDVLLWSVNGPTRRMEMLQRLADRYPDACLVFISANSAAGFTNHCLRLGARAVLNRSNPPDRLAELVRAISGT